MSEDTDITYSERYLIQRVIDNASSEHAYAVAADDIHSCPRWAIVKRLFNCGSTVARAICCRYGFDPEKMIGEAE